MSSAGFFFLSFFFLPAAILEVDPIESLRHWYNLISMLSNPGHTHTHTLTKKLDSPCLTLFGLFWVMSTPYLALTMFVLQEQNLFVLQCNRYQK